MEIKKITKKKYNNKVYNFHCLPDENYFSEGVLVHNCYKANTEKGHNMSIDTFKKVIDNLGPNLTQVALGADSKAESNPDLWKMMEYCREKGIIPNITVAEASDIVADNLAKYCGAVAVSRHDNKDDCYNTIKKLTDRGMTQINIHQIVAKQTLQDCFDVIDDRLNDDRLSKLNAIVFLTAKPIGRGTYLEKTSTEDYKRLIDYALERNVNIGFDSCGASKFLQAIKDHKDYKQFEQLAEPCESLLFSIYINSDAKVYPCSFLEKNNFFTGIDISEINIKEIWNSEQTKEWRKKLLSTKENGISIGCRQCPAYDIY
jgi:radical SAM protein with 4Fe4S-binding SPASM domain